MLLHAFFAGREEKDFQALLGLSQAQITVRPSEQ